MICWQEGDMGKSYKKEFQEWKRQYREDEFCESLPGVDLSIGDKVMFTNSSGITFGPYEVLAFQLPDKYGRCLFFDHDAYWFPATLESLRLCGQGKREKR